MGCEDKMQEAKLRSRLRMKRTQNRGRWFLHSLGYGKRIKIFVLTTPSLSELNYEQIVSP